MVTERRTRTNLEREIRRRGQTAEEFSEYAETFAREHGMRATLSARHLQRLMSGHGANGQPLGPVRPATRRLLEAILSQPIDELLSPPTEPTARTDSPSDPTAELRARLDASRAIDHATVSLFQQKLEVTRVLDRRLGALGLLGELRELIRQIEEVMRHTLRTDIRAALARILVDCSTLAGWQSLDRGEIRESWRHYDRAKTAARESQSTDLEAYATAAQSVVLVDIGCAADAVDLTTNARALGAAGPGMLRSWLAAAHGEACAANGNRQQCLDSFDSADRLMPSTPDATQTPYLVFGAVHLARWRGGALAKLGDQEGVNVLSDALRNLDPTFARAEAALRVDLAQVFSATGEHDAARQHAHHARQIAHTIGSARQRNRLAALGV